MAPELPRVGAVLGERFKLSAVIGAGAFSLVYRAWDRVWRREVAVKALKPEILLAHDGLARFQREALICSQLRHASVARLLYGRGVSVDPSCPHAPYLVFELVRGVSVGELIAARGPLDLFETVRVMRGVLGALREAHARGILHRDLKPSNVLVAAPRAHWVYPGRTGSVTKRLGIPSVNAPLWRDISALDARVLDFGLGKLLRVGDHDVANLTIKGVLAGTAHYMAPEQVRLEPVDHRADLYSSAMLFFRLITGRPPYTGEGPITVALKHVDEPLPELPHPWNAHPVASWFRRAGAKNPDARFRNAEEMYNALRGTLEGVEVAIPPLPERRPAGLVPELAQQVAAGGAPAASPEPAEEESRRMRRQTGLLWRLRGR